jgi:hypothetical protein
MPNPTFTGLLAEWADGCCEYTLYRAGEAKDRQCPLSVLKRLEAYEHYDQGLDGDLDRLRTLILRRLDGAERAREFLLGKKSGTHCSPGPRYDSAIDDVVTRALEALDG